MTLQDVRRPSQAVNFGSQQFQISLHTPAIKAAHRLSLSLPGQTIKTISLNHSSLSVLTTAALGPSSTTESTASPELPQ